MKTSTPLIYETSLATMRLLAAMEVSKQVYMARKARFDELAAKQKAKENPNVALLQLLNAELIADAEVCNLADALIQTLQRSSDKVTREVEEVNDRLADALSENVSLLSQLMHLRKSA